MSQSGSSGIFDGLHCLLMAQLLFGTASGSCIVLPVVSYQKGEIPLGLCENSSLEGEFFIIRCSCASPEGRRLA